jgi:hypothetical protein
MGRLKKGQKKQIRNADFFEKWAKEKGFSSYSQYQDFLAQRRGFANRKEYLNNLARKKGFTSYGKYHRDQSNKRERKIVLLSYSYGPYWNEADGGENEITLWEIKKRKLKLVYHPGEPFKVDNKSTIESLVKNKIQRVYTPSIKFFYEGETFLGLKRANDGSRCNEKDEITDWTEYNPISEGDENWKQLESSNLEIRILNSL